MKTCVKCGSTDFNVSGKCRPCVVIANKAYLQKSRKHPVDYMQSKGFLI